MFRRNDDTLTSLRIMTEETHLGQIALKSTHQAERLVEPGGPDYLVVLIFSLDIVPEKRNEIRGRI
jgi:hypothetical protein